VVRLFVADRDGDESSELTHGGRPVVRLTAPDLQRARRDTARIRADRSDVSVILDLEVAVPGDFRSSGHGATVHYAGTVDELTGLIADIDRAGVADGVTLIPAVGSPPQDLRSLALDVLRHLTTRERASA
jgi:hypothetical protein